MAADPRAVLVLLGMGVNGLSMSASSLPRIKWLIRHVSRRQTQNTLKKALEMDDSLQIRAYLEKVLGKVGMLGLVRAGK
jgi:signal transduction protein with GAF and PtsI domain